MRNRPLIFAAAGVLSALLLSLPWLVPHCGAAALVGFVPLLVAERLWEGKGFFLYYFGVFLLWNAFTTWWIWNATPGGAVFAIVANALQMALVFGSYRLAKRRLGSVLPYIYLAAAWIAWEKFYLDAAQISWPWLVLGNAFADTTSLVQWYSVSGHLGGSAWVWAANLAVFGIMVALSDGRMAAWNAKARVAAFVGAAAAVFGPMAVSPLIRHQEAEDKIDVVIGQPNLDPYMKFRSYTQEQQDRIFLDLVSPYVPEGRPSLVLAPETFTSSFMLHDPASNASFGRYQLWLQEHPDANLLFGASAYNVDSRRRDILSFRHGNAWLTSRNSAIVMDTSGRCQVFHKSKLVVGTELTPYPKLFLPLEKLLGGDLMGKCVGQDKVSCLRAEYPSGNVVFGCAVCYESVYGAYCTAYVREGARLMTVITNDAWWGNTPGYRQHFNYSRLRAIETGRWVVRCGNTGISGIIGPDGKVLEKGPWWERAVITGKAGLLDGITPFVRYGDITGRAAVLLFFLLAAAALLRGRKTSIS